MATDLDTSPELAGYAHPERLVTADWLSAHLGTPGLRVIESDEDVLLYDIGHIPTAQKVDWHLHLNDPVTRDYIDGTAFAKLMSDKGISRDDTVVIYGDKSNWWAAYALWVFTLFGHEDVRLLDGGRDKWIADGRDVSLDTPDYPPTDYPVVERDDSVIRAYAEDVRAALGRQQLVDVRSPQEYTGERTHMPDYPEEGALRGGHIPTAVSIPWAKAVGPDGRFLRREGLDGVYSDLDGSAPVTAYCRIGERSSLTWFVLKYLLGFGDVRNYDGSWTEWGNTVRAPIARGEEPGEAPAAL
ncbi:sulfurtransferase [Tsukamurella sp. 8F]|uniref:sulfurtransferase n=1 Tax=unclassified Tsukamurella TaxID=2633480 RepID=UPI0023BA21A1|nr:MULTISPECIES: sulfurtransferase [unclassified Tsukamurella]MDF0529008.1 sulfurtransferase [Tsukamurella sp. 8J]MDF0587381.1 sulfurtransferase [Tsukamurella sp. 8F]